ncbi:ATPase [Altererythrobacter aerius]|uniref:ATPase n=1 Tax=Tsuneonella aeria TaxID=1837929 RepID=A0A6I4TD82_9SPHN|nr:ATPase [Tsuneonella aeria]MXO74110.1 ATPase [Tsuneonella aeria]
MSGGTHIRAVGLGNPAEGPVNHDEAAAEPLTLDESWAEAEVHAEVDAPLHESGDWDASPARGGSRIAPALAISAVLAWTAFFAWANWTAVTGGISPQGGSRLLIDWTIPVLLVVAVWLLVMRMSRREAGRFADAAVALRSESEALEARLSTVNRELSLAREFLAAQSRELDTLGRVATQRIGEHADRLQNLVRDNGQQVDAIAGVSRAALDNMDRLRSDLPVIANAARDVSNQIGGAGNTAHEHVAELIAGLNRLNEFGLASERQVGSLRSRVDAAIAAFEAQATQLDEIAGNRFAALRERSEAFRTEMDGREVEVLAAMRHRADRLRAEIESTASAMESHEEELLRSLQARIAALREGAATVGDSLAGTERSALSSWNQRLAGLHAELSDAAAEVERMEETARARATARLQVLRDEAEQVAAGLAETQARFVADVDQRRTEALEVYAAQAETIAAQMSALDAEIAQRREGHLAHSAALADESAAIATRLAALGEKMAEAAGQGSAAQTAVAGAIETLAQQLAASRQALEGTDRAVADLTEASVRLLELIRASAEHSRTDLPAAIGDAEARLATLGQRGESLGLMLADAGERSRELSDYVLAASRETGSAMGDIAAFHGRIAAEHAQNAGQVAELRAALDALQRESRGAAEHASTELRGAIGQLEDAVRSAITVVETEGAARVRALADSIGEQAAGAIDRAVQARVGAALGELEGSASQAAELGRDAALQLRDQLARVNELAANLESRVAHARQRAEEQVDSDFARRVALITESLNSHAIDIAKALSTDVTDMAWTSYLRGDRGIFTRRAVRLIDSTQTRDIAELFDSDSEFREHVSRYIHDFEAMLRTMLSTRDGHAIGVTLLSSDMGKLYVVLAQAIERLRD